MTKRIEAVVVFRAFTIQVDVPDDATVEDYEDYASDFVRDHVSCDVYIDDEYHDSLVDSYSIEEAGPVE